MERRVKAEEWEKLTPAERVRLCRLFAEESRQHFEETSRDDMRELYLHLAMHWLQLADSVEREACSRSRHGRRVLVVEDEELIAREMVHALEGRGAEVVGPADCLERAMELAESADFDCALIDIKLDGSDAYPIADLLSLRKIPYAFVTGYAKMIPERYRDAAVFEKPINPAVIARAFDT